ncbi:MAG: hypothetical protein ACM3VT_07760 [Solirubrobacterales bacterium]
MKRTSLWLVLLALTPGISKAWYGSYCVRYTPYALTYQHSGLVSGVDYTPYAFTYRSSGLVPGYGISCESFANFAYPVRAAHPARYGRPVSHGSRPVRRHAQAVPEPVRPPNGMNTIRQHLLAKGIQSAGIDQILMVNNEIISVDFLLRDRNLLIKYWNPKGIEALTAEGGPRLKSYENYRRNWAEVAAEHEKNGGQIYYVEASDAQTIVASLNSCSVLNAAPETENETVLYAKDR